MNDAIEKGLLNIYQKYRLVWISIFIAMAGLVIITILIHLFEIITTVPVVNPELMDKVILLIIFILVLAIFFLKRSYLNIHKIITIARKSTKEIDPLNYPFINKEDEQQILLARSIETTNYTMMIIWFIANLVVIVAFVNYIFVPYIQTFLIYSLVGLYSFVINFPTLRHYKKINSYIFD